MGIDTAGGGEMAAPSRRAPLQSGARPENWPSLPCMLPDLVVPETSKSLRDFRSPALPWEPVAPPGAGEVTKCFVDAKFLPRALPREIRERTAGWKRAPNCWDLTTSLEEYPAVDPAISPGASGTLHEMPSDGSRQRQRVGRSVTNRAKSEATESRDSDSGYVSLQRKAGLSRSAENHIGTTAPQPSAGGSKKLYYADAGKADASVPGTAALQVPERAAGKGGLSETCLRPLMDDRLLAHVDLEALLVEGLGVKQPVVVGLDAFLRREVGIFAVDPGAPRCVAGILSAFSVIADNAVLLPKGTFLWELIYPQSESGWPLYNPQGLYYVKLFLRSQWRLVEIDDFIPCDAAKRPLAPVSSRDSRDLWPMLLAKAIWKAFQGEISRGVLDIPALEALTGRREIAYPLTGGAIRHFLTKGFWASVKIRPSETQGVETGNETEAGQGTLDPDDASVTFLVCNLTPEDLKNQRVCLRSGAFSLKRDHPQLQKRKNGDRQRCGKPHPAVKPIERGGRTSDFVFPEEEGACEEEYGGLFSVVSPEHPDNRAELMAQKAEAEARRKTKELRRDDHGRIVLCKPWGKLLKHFLGDALPHPLPEATLQDFLAEESQPITLRQTDTDSGLRPANGVASPHDAHATKSNKQNDIFGGSSGKAKPPVQVLADIIQRWQMPWPVQNVTDPLGAAGITYDGTVWVSWKTLTEVCRSEHLFVYVPSTLFETAASSDFFDYEQSVLPRQFPLRVAVCYMNIPELATWTMEKDGDGGSGSQAEKRTEGDCCPASRPRRQRPIHNSVIRTQFSPVPVLLEFDAHPPVTLATEAVQPMHQAGQTAPARPRDSPHGSSRNLCPRHKAAPADSMHTSLGGTCLVQSAPFFLSEGKEISPQIGTWERLLGRSVDDVKPLLGPEMRNAVTQGIELWRAGKQNRTRRQGTVARSSSVQGRPLFSETGSHLAFSAFSTYPTKGHALEMCAAPRFLTLDASCRAVTQLNLCQGRHAFFFWLDSPAGSGVFRVHWVPDKREKSSNSLESPPVASAAAGSTKSMKRQAAESRPASEESDAAELCGGISCHILSVESFLETFHDVQIEEFLVTAPESTLPGPHYTVWFKAELTIHSRFSRDACDYSPGAGSGPPATDDEQLAGGSELPTVFVTLNLPHGGLTPYLRMSIGPLRSRTPAKLDNTGAKSEREGLSSDFGVPLEEEDSSATGVRLGAIVRDSELKQLPVCPMLCIDPSEFVPKETDWDQQGSNDRCAATCEQLAGRPQSYLLLVESALPSPVPRVTFSVGIGARRLEVEGGAREDQRQRKTALSGCGNQTQKTPAPQVRVAVENISFRASWTNQTKMNGENIVLRERIIPKSSHAVSASLRVTVENLDSVVLCASLIEIGARTSPQETLQEKHPKNFVQKTSGSGFSPVTPRQQRQHSGARSNASPSSSGPPPRGTENVASDELLSAEIGAPAGGMTSSAMNESGVTAMARPSGLPSLGWYPTPPLEETVIESVGRDTVTFPHVQLDPLSHYVIQVVARKFSPVTSPTSRCAMHSEGEWDDTALSSPLAIDCSAPSRAKEHCWTAEPNAGQTAGGVSLHTRPVEMIHLAETASAERLRMAAPLDGGAWRLDVAATGEIEVAEDVCRTAFENQLFAFWNESDSSRAERAKRSRAAFLARKMKQKDCALSDQIDPPEALSSPAAFRQTVLWKLEMTEAQLLCLLARKVTSTGQQTEDDFSADLLLSEEISASAFAQCRLLQEATEATEAELQEFFFCEMDPTRTGAVKGAQFLMSLQNGGAALRSAHKDTAEERTAANRQPKATKGGNGEKKSKSGAAERDTKRPGAAQKSPASKLSKGDDQKRDSQQSCSLDTAKERISPYGFLALRRPLTSARHRNARIAQFIRKITAGHSERAVTVPGVFRVVPLGGAEEEREFAATNAAASEPAERRRAANIRIQEELTALRESIERASIRNACLVQEDREDARGSMLLNRDPVAKQREALRTLQRKRRDVASKVTEVLQEETEKEIRKEELEQLMEECQEIRMWFFDSCLMKRLRNQHTAVTAMQR
ncbi:hypothetical protein NCLIV_060540 [Neospora caninum Liverpool]|nr:hypothetical protein NCLIV_060540 [Neospora caninum Liverpool]CBZ55629.1 hypothetical protein NCLIV_060540 [Neospora caninum Liverpool]|eukprot:XP_003885657.1 hypothetical protein NCLIV_060540 [Neospora caninum Liverpool]